MADGDASYRSTVLAPLQLGLGLLSAAAAAAVLWAMGLWPAAIVAFVGIVAVAVWVGVVGLEVTPLELIVRQTRSSRGGRDVLVRNIESAEAVTFGWAETFGFGSAVPAGTATLVVRPGPGLRLLLNDGERLHISTPDPQAALSVMRTRAAATAAAPIAATAAAPIAATAAPSIAATAAPSIAATAAAPIAATAGQPTAALAAPPTAVPAPPTAPPVPTAPPRPVSPRPRPRPRPDSGRRD